MGISISSIIGLFKSLAVLPESRPVEAVPINKLDSYSGIEKPDSNDPFKRFFDSEFDAVAIRGLRAMKPASLVDQIKVKTRLALSGATFYQPSLENMERLPVIVKSLSKSGVNDLATGFIVNVYTRVINKGNVNLAAQFEKQLSDLFDQVVTAQGHSLVADTAIILMQSLLEQKKYNECADFIFKRLIPSLDTLPMHPSGIESQSDLLLKAMKLYLKAGNSGAAIDVMVLLAEKSVPTEAIIYLEGAQKILLKQNWSHANLERLSKIHDQIGELYQKYSLRNYPDFLMGQVKIFENIDYPGLHERTTIMREKLVEAHVQAQQFEKAIVLLHELSDRAMDDGIYPVAINQLRRAAQLANHCALPKRNLMKQHSLYRLARAYGKAGDLNHAEGAYRQLLTDLKEPHARLSVLESLLMIAEQKGYRNTGQLWNLIKDVTSTVSALGKSLFDVTGVLGAIISLVKKSEHSDDIRLLMTYVKSASFGTEKINLALLCELYAAIVLKSSSMAVDEKSVNGALTNLTALISGALDRNVTVSEIRSLDVIAHDLKRRYKEAAIKIWVKAANIEIKDNKVATANMKYFEAFELARSVEDKIWVASEYAVHSGKWGRDVFPDILLPFFLSDKIKRNSLEYGKVGSVLTDALWQRGRYVESFTCFSLVIKNWLGHGLYSAIYHSIGRFLKPDALDKLTGKNILTLAKERVRAASQMPDSSVGVVEISDWLRVLLGTVADKVDRAELDDFLTDLRVQALTSERPQAQQKLTLLMSDLDADVDDPLACLRTSIKGENHSGIISAQQAPALAQSTFALAIARARP